MKLKKQNMINQNTTLVPLVIVCIGLVIAVIVMSFQSSDIGTITLSQEKDTISVSGVSEISVDPDEVTAYIEVITLEQTAKEAQDENSKMMGDVISALKKSGITSDDIETENFNLYPKYEWIKESREFIGYEASHTLKVKTTDVDGVGKYLDVAVNAGANRISRVTFGLSNEKEIKVNEVALEKAAELASAKANSIADNLDVKLGKLSKISESNTNYRTYDYYPESVEEMSGAVLKVSTQISPSKVNVNAYISLVYYID